MHTLSKGKEKNDDRSCTCGGSIRHSTRWIYGKNCVAVVVVVAVVLWLCVKTIGLGRAITVFVVGCVRCWSFLFSEVEISQLVVRYPPRFSAELGGGEGGPKEGVLREDEMTPVRAEF